MQLIAANNVMYYKLGPALLQAGAKIIINLEINNTLTHMHSGFRLLKDLNMSSAKFVLIKDFAE